MNVFLFIRNTIYEKVNFDKLFKLLQYNAIPLSQVKEKNQITSKSSIRLHVNNNNNISKNDHEKG